MESLVLTILILALIDFLLTAFWIYRWQSSIYVRDFKYKIPIKLIEANPLIQHFIKYFGRWFGLTVGYSALVLIQLALTNWNKYFGYAIVVILVWAIIKHFNNNGNTSNKHIIKMTREYNKVKRKKK